MPWLRMYLMDGDVEMLCGMLSADPEIALVRPAGRGKWKAHRKVPTLPDGKYALWHISSGPIELEPREPKAKPKKIKDPFAGWTELVESTEPGVPWVSPGPLGIFWLDLYRMARGKKITMGMTTMNWIGRYYSIIGYKPAEATELWWQSLRRWIAKSAVKVSVSGSVRGPGEVWAFPHALERLRRRRR